MRTHMYYPDTTTERYWREVEELTMLGGQLLFVPRRMGAVYHPDFVEYLEGEDDPSLVGLPAFQEYRYEFGHPVLHRVNYFAAAPSKARFRLRGGGQFTWDGLMELNFEIPFDSLAPEWREGLSPQDSVFKNGRGIPIQLRMREPNFARRLTAAEAPLLGIPADTLMIIERSYWPYLVNRMGRPHEQIDHVGAQVAYYANTGRPMWTDDAWTPTWVAYNGEFEDKFRTNPVSGY